MVSGSETRLTRRLARYWTFVLLSSLIATIAYLYYSGIHAMGSSLSASVGILGARYVITAIGSFYLLGFMLVVIFLAFDVRARDVRERMQEILDSRPISNMELVLGRFLGLMITAWLPVFILMLFLQGLGWLLFQLGSPIGGTMEPVSVIGYLFFIALPGLAFAFALVFFITLLVRNRLIAAVLSIVVLGGSFIAAGAWSAFARPFADFLGFTVTNLPSDIVPSVAPLAGWLQRLAFLLITAGLLVVSAIIYPRLDGAARSKQGVIAAGLLIGGAAVMTFSATSMQADARNVERWRLAHEDSRNQTMPDIVSLQGSVVIDPGDAVTADLEITVEASGDGDLGSLLFTLNPGFESVSVTDSSGQPLEISHEDGLLSVQLPARLRAGERMDLNLDYSGRPDIAFAYLDGNIDLRGLSYAESTVALLGLDNAVFDSRFVTLMPGIHWLPKAGVAVGLDDTRDGARDFYDLALEVSLPSSWTVAGPGRRIERGSDGQRSVVAFEPEAPLPEVALIAGEFTSFSAEIEGILFEVLLHPDHDENMAELAGAREAVIDWVAERVVLAADAGLHYPYGAFTLVEVPNTLRGYEGGWRMGTALAPPGMVLMKETGLPTARFDTRSFVRISDNSVNISIGNTDAEEITPEEDLARLIEFFGNDLTGGNVFAGIARSLYDHQTSATGSDAIAMDYALRDLTSMAISGRRSYFSVDWVQEFFIPVGSVRPGASIFDTILGSITGNPEVWEAALDAPLTELEPRDHPDLIVDMLALKAGGMAQAIHDSSGPRTAGRIVGSVVEQNRGQGFTRADLMRASAEVDPQLGRLVEDWLGGTGMAGFVADQLEVYQLAAEEGGGARYQLKLRLRNDEETTGFARIAWAEEAGGSRTRSDPIRVPGRSAVEFAVVLSEPPNGIYIEPYLSLNRRDFLVQIVNPGEIRTRNEQPVSETREVPWTSDSDQRIMADDLDEGFVVVGDKSQSGSRLIGMATWERLDEGLPVATGSAPTVWSRNAITSAWGQYRHTAAYIRPGDGSRKVVLNTELPESGRWELEIHMPFINGVPNDQRGNWKLAITTSAGRQEFDFNASAATLGWNLAGEFELPAGKVGVEFSDATDGRVVIADAVAWSPAN